MDWDLELTHGEIRELLHLIPRSTDPDCDVCVRRESLRAKARAALDALESDWECGDCHKTNPWTKPSCDCGGK